MNLGELTTAIQNYCQSSEPLFTGQINDFIRTSEDRVYRSIQLPAFFQSTATSGTFSGASLDLPDGAIEVYGIRASSENSDGPWSYLLRKDWDFLREAYPEGDTNLGVPRYYAVGSADTSTPGSPGTGTDPVLTIKVAPTPAASTEYSADYYGKVTTDSITSAGTATNTTWLSVTFPDVLLYGALVDAYTFLKSEAQMIQYYEQRFHEGMATMASTVTGEQVEMGAGGP